MMTCICHNDTQTVYIPLLNGLSHHYHETCPGEHILVTLNGISINLEYFVLILKHLQGKMKIFLLLSLFLYVHTKIVPKPGTGNNKLFASYGTNFRYMGEIKNGLKRVLVVTSIPTPRFRDIQVDIYTLGIVHWNVCLTLNFPQMTLAKQ